MIRKLLIDTDIGDDVDDAFALALVAGRGERNLVGVTTVYKNARERAKIASHLLREFRIDAPVVPGLDRPPKEPVQFLCFERPADPPKIDQLLEEMKAEPVSEDTAPEFILEMAKIHGKDLTILAIGPFTNLAAAYERDPEVFNRIGEIVFMGGDATGRRAEWNVRCDPESFSKVLESVVPLRMIGIEITEKSGLSEASIASIRAMDSPSMKIVSRLMDRYIANYKGARVPVMHDPLAASVLYRDFLTFEPRFLGVNLEGPKRGSLLIDPTLRRVEAAVSADYESFEQFLLQSLSSIH